MKDESRTTSLNMAGERKESDMLGFEF
jgi:hypothetical protein